MTLAGFAQEAPSVLLVDENGRLPGHHEIGLNRDRRWRACRVEHLVEAFYRMEQVSADSLIFAPAAARMIDRNLAIRTIRLLRPTLVVGVVLEAASEEEIRWLDAGADFVLAMPFHAEQAIAHLRAALRLQRSALARSLAGAIPAPLPAMRHDVLELGQQFRFDPVAGLVTDLACKSFDLAPHELAILKALAGKPNQALSRDELSRKAFGRPWQYGDRSVDRTIMALRQRLGLDPARGPIRSRRNAGYILLSEHTKAA